MAAVGVHWRRGPDRSPAGRRPCAPRKTSSEAAAWRRSPDDDVQLAVAAHDVERKHPAGLLERAFQLP